MWLMVQWRSNDGAEEANTNLFVSQEDGIGTLVDEVHGATLEVVASHQEGHFDSRYVDGVRCFVSVDEFLEFSFADFPEKYK